MATSTVSFDMGPEHVAKYERTIRTLRTAAYSQRLQEVGKQMGLSGKLTRLDGGTITKLTHDAPYVAKGIVDTYNKDLQNQIDALDAVDPPLSSAEKAKELRDWQSNRAGWKASQIAQTEGMNARRAVMSDLLKQSDKQPMAHAIPDTAECVECQDLLDQGSMPWDEAEAALDSATHPHCIHSLEVDESLSSLFEGQDVTIPGVWSLDDNLIILSDGNILYLYSADQPRDDHGRFEGGGSGGGGGGGSAREKTIAGGHAGEPTMLDSLKKTGGFTYQANKGQNISLGSHGFGVSPYPERETVIEGRQATRADVHSFVTKNVDLLHKPDHYVGGWFDPETGKTYLDVSVVAKTASQAEKISRDFKQEAYFDYSKGQSVYVRARQEDSVAASASYRYRDRRFSNSVVRFRLETGAMSVYA